MCVAPASNLAREVSYPAALQLSTLAAGNGAEVVLFMTWVTPAVRLSSGLPTTARCRPRNSLAALTFSAQAGPSRSHRLPEISTNTATLPYSSVRGSVTKSTPAVTIRS